MLPTLLSLPWYAQVAVVVSSIYATTFILTKLLFSPKRFLVSNSVTVITGGSEGIGLSAAQAIVKRGGRVALLSRRLAPLQAAQKLLEETCDGKNKVLVVPTDVTDFAACQAAIDTTVAKFGRVDAIANCAGMSIPKTFEDLTADEWDRQYRVNVLGSRNATRAALPQVKRHGNGRVLLTSSMAGQASFYGFTSYSSTKFALLGFAQALQSEVLPDGVRVSVMYPPDTDTPGFARENTHKPAITAKLSEGGGLFTPEQVAANMVDGMEAGDFGIFVGFDGHVLGYLAAGFSPGTPWQVLLQATCMGVLRLVSYGYVLFHNSVVAAGVKKFKAQ